MEEEGEIFDARRSDSQFAAIAGVSSGKELRCVIPVPVKITGEQVELKISFQERYKV